MIKFREDNSFFGDDIFEYVHIPNVALVNPVNCIGVMGKGLAAEFKSKYPDNFKAYAEHCKQSRLKPGGVFWYQDDQSEVTIANLATKNHWREPSLLHWIVEGVKNLFNYNGPLVIPMIGCGLGGLHWPDVRAIIVKHLTGHPHDIYVLGRGTGIIDKIKDGLRI